jgi:hypothetical protein
MDGNRSDYNDNYFAPLLTGGGEWRLRGLLDAVSEIQQFWVLESKGKDIPKEWLTIKGTLNYLKTGMGSAFVEGVFLFLFFPVFQFYLIPFVFHFSDWTTTVLIEIIPFTFLISNTILCFYVSRFYVGTLTRRAINALYMGRIMVLMIKSFLMYSIYFCAVKLAKPEWVWALARHLPAGTAERFYYGVFKVLPHVIPDTAICAVAILLSAVLPYGSAYYLDHRRRKKMKKNAADVSGQRRE